MVNTLEKSEAISGQAPEMEFPKWSREAISNLISNEKIHRTGGQVLLQKTVTTGDSQIENNGFMDRYFYTDNHEAIISDEVFAAGDAKRDEGLTTPESVIRYDDLPYGGNPKWQVLDLYLPRDFSGERYPVIVNWHGGGWVYRSKEVYQFYCMDLAQRGFAVGGSRCR